MAARRLIGLMAAVRDEYGVTLAELNLGGGHAVPYMAGDADFDLNGFATRVRQVISAECAKLRLPVPRLTVEPGRAIVNRAMVTLYHVVAIKQAPNSHTYVVVDGGMSDNPRPGLYGARYPVHAVQPSHAPLRTVTVASRTARPVTCSRWTCRYRRTSGPAMSSPCPGRAPTTTRWHPPTTWSGGRRWSRWPMAPRACWSAGRRAATCCFAMLAADRPVRRWFDHE